MQNHSQQNKTVKFGVFADLHIDIMHDSLFRLKAFLSSALSNAADFIVNLGDLAYPDNLFMAEEAGEDMRNRSPKAFVCNRDGEKREALEMLASCGKPVYHVLGNHEMDICTKKQAMKYLHMDKAYYSYDIGQYHFIVLDCNYILTEGRYKDYQSCNYHEYPAGALPYLPPEQLAWLEQDIMATPFQSVIFSHQSLSGPLIGIRNREDLWKTLKKVNSDKKRVLMCMNGHSHIDGMAEHEGVFFVDVNSMSNFWLGSQYSAVRYDEDIDRNYPYIKYTAPFKDPLYAIVTISDGQIEIKGRKSSFAGPSPYDLGFPRTASEYSSTATISDRVL